MYIILKEFYLFYMCVLHVVSWERVLYILYMLIININRTEIVIVKIMDDANCNINNNVIYDLERSNYRR